MPRGRELVSGQNVRLILGETWVKNPYGAIGKLLSGSSSYLDTQNKGEKMLEKKDFS